MKSTIIHRPATRNFEKNIATIGENKASSTEQSSDVGIGYTFFNLPPLDADKVNSTELPSHASNSNIDSSKSSVSKNVYCDVGIGYTFFNLPPLDADKVNSTELPSHASNSNIDSSKSSVSKNIYCDVGIGYIFNTAIPKGSPLKDIIDDATKTGKLSIKFSMENNEFTSFLSFLQNYEGKISSVEIYNNNLSIQMIRIVNTRFACLCNILQYRPEIESLSLVNCNLGINISDWQFKPLSRITSLKSVNFSNNDMGDNKVAVICRLPNLVSLDISQNKIGKDGAFYINQFLYGQLTHLYIHNNPKIGNDGAKDLSKKSSTLIHIEFYNIGKIDTELKDLIQSHNKRNVL